MLFVWCGFVWHTIIDINGVVILENAFAKGIKIMIDRKTEKGEILFLALMSKQIAENRESTYNCKVFHEQKISACLINCDFHICSTKCLWKYSLLKWHQFQYRYHQELVSAEILEDPQIHHYAWGCRYVFLNSPLPKYKSYPVISIF